MSEENMIDFESLDLDEDLFASDPNAKSKDIVNCYENYFIHYAVSVIISRAIPFKEDGLKPVQRRILYAMHELGLSPNKPYRKCARIVGDVLGKYHPHGDTSVYGALVKMAQPFYMRYPLVDGHGNFGSIDGDGAAAMRYTEAKLTKIGEAVLGNIDKKLVPFSTNFDYTDTEPNYLFSYIPNLLANGSFGIAVGMATKIPPHNLTEVYDALILILKNGLENKNTSFDDLLDIIKGPDFPTGGIIANGQDIRKIYKRNNGSFEIISRYKVKDNKIIINEIPYGINKEKMVSQIRDMMKKENQHYINDLKEIIDASDKKGINILITLKQNGNVDKVLAHLIKYSDFKANFSINFNVIHDKTPITITLKQYLEQFIVFCIDNLIKEFNYEKEQLDKQLFSTHTLILAKEKIEDIIKALNKDNIEEELYKIGFNEEEIKLILDTKISNLSNKSYNKLLEKEQSIKDRISDINNILSDKNLLIQNLIERYEQMKKKFGDKRITEINQIDTSVEIEDLIEDSEVVIVYTNKNIIKSIKANDFKTQNRSGKGSSNKLDDDEYIKFINTVNRKDTLLFFTNMGRCCPLKAYEIDLCSKTNKGKSIYNYIDLKEDEVIIDVIFKRKTDKYLLFGTKQGILKKMSYDEITNRNINVIKIKDGNSLVRVLPLENDGIINIITASGKSLTIDTNKINAIGRNGMGVKGIKIKENDKLVDIVIKQENNKIFLITEKGFGKTIPFDSFKVQNRGGIGVICNKVNEKTGQIVGALSFSEDDLILIATMNGKFLKVKPSSIKHTESRNTLGVKVISLDKNDIVSTCTLNKEEVDTDV